VRRKDFWYYYLSSCLKLSQVFLSVPNYVRKNFSSLTFLFDCLFDALFNFAYAPFQFSQEFPFNSLQPPLKSTKQHVPHPSSSHSLNHLIIIWPNIHQQKRLNSPVIKLLASLIKNAAAPLYSSGLLNLPSIFCFGHSSLLSGNFSNSASTIAVTI
jgi:hypothetical protein